MSRPLTGCSIAGSLKHPGAEFSAVAASLRYQADALGIAIDDGANSSDGTELAFEFKTPHTAPVSCEVTRWLDKSLQTPVSETILQAACGLMSVHGRANGGVKALGADYIATLSAALALQGGIAAALGQLRGLSVSHSSVAMAAAALLSMGQYIAGATAEEAPEKLLPDRIAHPPCPPFVSADGIVFELETLDAGPWQRFWAEIGISPAAAGKGWTAFLQRYAKAVAPVPEELIKALLNQPYWRISELSAASGIAVCPLRSIADRARDADCKRSWEAGPWEFGFAPAAAGRLNHCNGALPFSGLTVIESCRRIQGPLAGHLLALLGARVIRIEPPGGDPLRGMPPLADGCSARFDALNRLKTIREIDIKSAAGQAEIYELAHDADVFLHNWAPGKAAQLNLDYEHLAAANPALIYAYAAGWATPGAVNTDLDAMPGTDFMTQAYSGVARKIAAASGSLGGSLFTVLDVLGGVVAAQGVTVALLKRQLHGTGGKVTSSLLSAATLLSAKDLQHIYEAPNTDTVFEGAIDAVYPAQQGKINVVCRDRKTVQRLAALLGVAEHGLQQRLPDLLAVRPADYWAKRFEAAGIPCTMVIEDLVDLQYDRRLIAHFIPGSYTKVASPWRFS